MTYRKSSNQSLLEIGAILSSVSSALSFATSRVAADEAADLYRTFLDYCEHHHEHMEKLFPRDRGAFLSKLISSLGWVYQLASPPRVLDAVKSVLGEDSPH